MSGRDIQKQSSLWIRFRLPQYPLSQGLLPTCGKELALAQTFSSGSVIPIMVHDSIGGCDRPFGTRAIPEL